MEGKETHLLHSGDERGVMEKTEMRTKTQGNERKKSKGFGVRGVRNSSPSKHHISSCDLLSQKQIKHYSWQDVSFVWRVGAWQHNHPFSGQLTRVSYLKYGTGCCDTGPLPIRDNLQPFLLVQKIV